MADRFIYEQSMLTDTPSSPFLKKQVVYVQDTMNTSDYTGQIVVDLSQLSNSYQWIDFTSMTLEMPFQIVVEKTAGTLANMNTLINSFFVGLKNPGAAGIIQSLTVNLNNTSVVQLSNYLSHYVEYKLMTSFSNSDVKKWGTSINFSPDSATSFQKAGAGSLDGCGYVNNRPNAQIAADYGTTAFNGTQNVGFADRLRNTVQNFHSGAWYDDLIPANSITSNYISNMTNVGADKVVFNILATIRMKDICHLFSELPLLRGTFCNMIINYNSSVQTLTFDTDAATFVSATPQITGLTNPILISSAAANQPNDWLTAAVGAGNTATIKVSTNVGNVIGGGAPQNLLGGKCRIQAELYTMNPIFEERYLSLRTKDVYYTDVYTYLYQNQIGGGESFNFLATNGISQPTKVIVIPYISKASNTGLTSVPIYQSPFASEPGTTSSIPITNWQVQVSGSNIFQSDFQWDYQQFLTEVAESDAINGGKSTGLTSGLIGLQDFVFGYRYLVADLSRRLPADDIARSIQIQGSNTSAVGIDLLVCIEYQRKLTFDLSTGAIVPTMK